ncbi:MAG: DNA methyltransferase [Opitutaceae bacterium]
MPRKKKTESTKMMFRDPSGQQDFIERSYEEELDAKSCQPVECLGRKFPNDDARRDYFLGELAKKLKDPEFRRIDGFPHGEDEDILALSDPPYYTACPNPWIVDFIIEWQTQQSETPVGNHYPREPFAANVSEGKNDPIYNAHSYHTKVPHKAIMRYILHYTQPGDIVLDGFCGSGMTGVAAQMCGDVEVVRSLGYQVKPNGTILREEMDENSNKVWRPFSKLGARKAVLNDLSSAATFIASRFNDDMDAEAVSKTIAALYREIESSLGWMHSTIEGASDDELEKINEQLEACTTPKECRDLLSSENSLCARAGVSNSLIRIRKLNFIVWTDFLICNNCSAGLSSFDHTMLVGEGKALDAFNCPQCGANVSKSTAKKELSNRFDHTLSSVISQPKSEPAYVCFFQGKSKIRRRTNSYDKCLAKKTESLDFDLAVPTKLFLGKGSQWGDSWRAGYHEGITHTHHFYHKRNLLMLSAMWDRLRPKERWILTSFISRNATKLNRFIINNHNVNGRVNGPLSGTLYISSESVEQSALELLKDRRIKSSWKNSRNVISSQSGSSVSLPEGCINYVFVDPPFGGNLMYSELNFITETWLGVTTNQLEEAITNEAQKKTLIQYQALMADCFKVLYRALRAGGWITVEFSNSRASVWNSIQSTFAGCWFCSCQCRVS